MTVDLPFLADVSALAEFVACLRIDNDLRGRVERLRCDVHQMKRELAVREERREMRERVKRQMYQEAR